jgi:putative membrane protein
MHQGRNWGQKSPGASRSRSTASCHPLARLPAVPSPERILERIPKSPRNQKGATRLVSCAAREPHDPGVHIMKRSLLITVGCGLFASVALAQTPPAGTRTPSAQDFVNKVAISDMFEIQSSQLALSKEPDADTKPFADKMVQDHQKTSSELKAVVEGSMVKLILPTTMDSEHQKMLEELKAKSGKDFDASYDQIQVKAHRDAVALFEAYSKSGEDSELKTWAGKTLPHLKEHLSMAEKLK